MKYQSMEQIIERLNECNIEVNEYKENDVLCGYELNTYTDAGVNKIIFIDFRDTEIDPTDAKAFIEFFNDRVEGIDINEELYILSEDNRYMNEIGLVIGAQDLKDWKEKLKNIFSSKSPQQIQYEQVVDKLRSQLQAMEDTLKLMPRKGNNPSQCQRTNIGNYLGGIDMCINGIELEDFTPNEYSGDFKFSYS